MMDVQERAEESWNNDRSDVMSAFLMRMSEFFCPPDRELALRGQIKTGWSTVAARKKSRQSQMKLPPQELKHIREVVAQAEALQVAEELRIGVQMLKLQRLRNSCRGNGTSSCILCGHDFQHHRSRSPISLHFCHECGQAVCSRCKSEYKCHTGNTVVLCRLCSDQRELWKKSGAWLSNKLPVVNFSEEELDRVQQQRQVQKVVPLRTEFMVSPSRLEDDDETEDDLSTISGSTANYGGFPYLAGSAPSSRSPSPDMSFMSEANAAAAAWRGNRPPSTELHPKSQGPLPHQLSMTTMRKSGSYDLVAIHKQKASALPSQERSMTMVRKQAMSGEKKKDMEESRRKVVERKKASEQKRSLVQDNPRMPSPPILSVELTQVKPSQSSDLPVVNSRLSPMMLSSPHPHIKVVMATPPTSPDILGGENRSESTLVEKRVASEPIPKVPKPDSTTVQSSVSSETPPAQQPKQSDSDATSAVGKKRKPVPSPRKKQQTSDSELRATTTTTQQEPTQEPVEFKRIVTSNVEGRKYGTLEREKKPTAAPRKRSSSLDKEKSREYKSGTLERKQRASKTPEPQPFEFKKVASPSKETSLGGSEPNTASPSFTAVLPADVSKELARELQTMKQAPPDVSPSMKDEGLPTNPTLREIGKTSTVAPDASVDSIMEPSDRNDSTGSGDHKWQRKGAKRVGGRPRRTAHTTQQDFEDDDPSPRTRTRSGAVSGGSSAAAMRSHQHNTTEEESHSRSRTRSGAMSGSDAVVLRRGHHGKTSPRPAHRVVRSGPLPERDHGDFPEPPFGNEPENSEEAVSMRRARNAHRRAARTGSDFLVATDGQYGSIELTLEHFAEDQRLSVTIHSCRGLRGIDRQGLSDPYVKLFLAPSCKKDAIFKTIILRRTLAPEYDQDFVFQEVPTDSLEKKSLILVVTDHHDASKDQPIGGINVPLYEVAPDKRTRIRKLLNDPEKVLKEVLEETGVGRVELSFSYDPQSSVLKVGIHQAVILKPPSKGSPNPYVTGHLQTLAMSVNVKHKTRVVHHAALPIFDEVLKFSVESAQLCLAILTISVWDHRKIAKDIFLGQVTLRGRKFWEKVKDSNLLCFEWYHLQQQQDSGHVPSPLYSTL